MKNTIYHITLDVHNERESPTVRLKQGASAHRLSLRLTEDGHCYPIEPQHMAVFTGKKPDGTLLYNACQICDGAAVYDLTGQETNVSGCIPCELRIYDREGTLLISPTFCLLVEDAVYSDDGIIDSSSEFTALTELVALTLDVIAQCEEWLENAENYATAKELEALRSLVGQASDRVDQLSQRVEDANILAEKANRQSALAETTANAAARNADYAVALAREAIETAGVSEERVLELIRAEMVLDFSAMDEVIGGV